MAKSENYIGARITASLDKRLSAYAEAHRISKSKVVVLALEALCPDVEPPMEAEIRNVVEDIGYQAAVPRILSILESLEDQA